MATSTKIPPAVRARRAAPLVTPTDLEREGTRDSAAGLNRLLADVFALYFKTKNFHWHMSGPHFRDSHLLLDEQADQLYSMTDPMVFVDLGFKPAGRTPGLRRPARLR